MLGLLGMEESRRLGAMKLGDVLKKMAGNIHKSSLRSGIRMLFKR